MKKCAYYGTLLVLICVFLFSAYKVGDYLLEKYRSDRLLEDMSEFVTVETDSTDDQHKDPERIKVDFAKIRKQNEDVVAWLYCANTKLNYPIVQTDNNEYYLHHLLDGSWNNNGTIFMDYRNHADFSDGNTLIHGHHMRSGAMFGQLVKYQKQEFYDEHPYLYVMTPEKNYRLDLLAGCVVENTSDIYNTQISADLLNYFLSHSTFATKAEYQGGRIVSLSTCSYDFEDARYVVLGELIPLKD